MKAGIGSTHKDGQAAHLLLGLFTPGTVREGETAFDFSEVVLDGDADTSKTWTEGSGIGPDKVRYSPRISPRLNAAAAAAAAAADSPRAAHTVSYTHLTLPTTPYV